MLGDCMLRLIMQIVVILSVFVKCRGVISESGKIEVAAEGLCAMEKLTNNSLYDNEFRFDY